MVFLRGTTYTYVATLSYGTIYGVTDYNQAWTVDMDSSARGYNDLDANVQGTEDDDSDSDSDSESERESDDDDVTDIANELPSDRQPTSEAYTEFLQFLELGCSGSPVDGYPLLLVVLAGMPKSVWFTLYVLGSA